MEAESHGEVGLPMAGIEGVSTKGWPLRMGEGRLRYVRVNASDDGKNSPASGAGAGSGAGDTGENHSEAGGGDEGEDGAGSESGRIGPSWVWRVEWGPRVIFVPAAGVG